VMCVTPSGKMGSCSWGSVLGSVRQSPKEPLTSSVVAKLLPFPRSLTARLSIRGPAIDVGAGIAHPCANSASRRHEHCGEREGRCGARLQVYLDHFCRQWPGADDDNHETHTNQSPTPELANYNQHGLTSAPLTFGTFISGSIISGRLTGRATPEPTTGVIGRVGAASI
jgi:hypothetical protein